MCRSADSSVYLWLGRAPNRGGFYRSIPGIIQSVADERYQVGDRIGYGGNAVVHECVHQGGQVPELAVKFLINRQGKRLERFERERDLLIAVDHPNLVKYYGHGTVAASEYSPMKRGQRRIVEPVSECRIPFIIMERAESTLDTAIKARTLWRTDYYVSQFRGLAEALGALHDHAVHRDIKPSNILICAERWILGDFGLCKFHEGNTNLTLNGERVGPRGWMSPEAANRAQGGRDDITRASDVHQIAQIFWYIVNGAHLEDIPARDHWRGPGQLYEPIAMALNDDPSQRPQDGKEFAALLETAVTSA